jgi:hypothetical protein
MGRAGFDFVFVALFRVLSENLDALGSLLGSYAFL